MIDIDGMEGCTAENDIRQPTIQRSSQIDDKLIPLGIEHFCSEIIAELSLRRNIRSGIL
ncbi:hypothetical protein SDC9_195967 [bioreactor metagenome]|uniref:Uncharacterized protein n=1 Tax=bioreactor metagenome TaxID=1076179 RepID=A0A645IB59_9ZZZZ